MIASWRPVKQAYKGDQMPDFQIGVSLYEHVGGSLLKAALAEFVCTLAFIFLATGTIAFGCHSSDVGSGSSAGGQTTQPTDCFLNSTRVLTIATSFGFTIFTMVYVSAAFSGGHLNPAVTLAFLLTKKVSLLRATIYFIAQIAGAIAGSALVRAVDPVGFLAAGGGTNRLLPGIYQVGGWLLETILTTALVFVVFAATDHARSQSTAHLPILAPFAIGMVVFCCHLAGIAIDGTSINPARSFGPAVVSGKWGAHWIYWVGPFSGAIIGSMLYELGFRPSHPPIRAVGEQVGSGEQGIQLPGYAGVSGLADAEMDGTGDAHAAAGNGAGPDIMATNNSDTKSTAPLRHAGVPHRRDTANSFDGAAHGVTEV